MIALILLAVIVLLIVAVIALAAWGAMTAATSLTLAATNAVMQTTLALLACSLAATSPLMLFAAWRLGVWRAERDDGKRRAPRVLTIAQRARANAPLLDAGQRTALLPAPRDETPEATLVYPASMPRARRAAPRTRHAARIAQRWFR